MPTDEERIKELKDKLKLYEQNGAAKLAYALNRKMNEMADLLNKSTLSTLDLTDPKDKTFERLKVVWNDGASISTAFKTLADAAGITNNEESDINKSPFKRTTPESIADVFGDNKGQEI